MRTQLGVIGALTTVAAVVGLSLGAGASAAPDEFGTAPVESTIVEVTPAETSPGESTSTTTTTVPVSTSVPTTTVPANDELALSSGAEVAGPVSRASADPTLSTDVADRIDGPGQARQPAGRTGETVQLTEPPPAPTTTTTTTIAPPPRDQLPAGSGEGRRIVYSKSNQWVWLVEADGTIARNTAVSGSRQWNLPIPGTYSVSSKSMHTCSIENPSLCWRYMVRFARGPNATWRDNIGFHEIPINTNSGRPVQGDWQLGEPLSGGCVRMNTADITFLWNWTPVGTRVVVLP